MKQKKLIFNFFVNRNWKKLADNRKRAKILADNRKCHHPIETLVNIHSPLFFRKIIEIERFALRAAILHECQNYPRAIIPDARPLGTFENQDTRDGKTRYI